MLFMLDFLERSNLAEAPRDRITDIECLVARRSAQAGVDLIRTGGDS